MVLLFYISPANVQWQVVVRIEDYGWKVRSCKVNWYRLLAFAAVSCWAFSIFSNRATSALP